MKYTNTSAVPLSLAVFLASDFYDHNDDPYTISATTLIKPLRQIILSARVPATEAVVDLAAMLQSRMGTAIHDGIERSWKDNHQIALKALGYPDKLIERIRVNPDPTQLDEKTIPIYLEQRLQKKVGKWTVTGKFDFIGEGRLEDFKTTSVFTVIHNTNDDKYVLQGSIYRWLDPQKITQDEMAIQFIFTDWSKAKALADPKYPQQRFQQHILQLKSIQEIEAYVQRKLALIEQYWDMPEETIPYCDDADLWRSEPVWKYYKNPQKTNRSTKNFDNKHDAYLRLAEDGNVGMVLEQPGQVTACKYCAAFNACSQKDQLVAAGDLQL